MSDSYGSIEPFDQLTPNLSPLPQLSQQILLRSSISAPPVPEGLREQTAPQFTAKLDTKTQQLTHQPQPSLYTPRSCISY